MKKLHLLASASILATFLVGCANNPPVPVTGEPPEPTPADSTTAVAETTKENTSMPNGDKAKQEAQATTDSMKSMQAPGPDLTPQPTATIKLSQKGDQIIAKVSTNWNNTEQGDLYLKWVAPKGTTCHSTQLPITKYKDSNDVSSAKRPVTSLYTDKACNGIWKVKVVTKNGATVSDESINIAPTTAEQTDS